MAAEARDGVVFETERLRAVPWREDHAEAAFAAYSQPEMVQFLGNGATHPDIEHTRAWIGRIRKRYDDHGVERGFWALERRDTDEVVGATIRPANAPSIAVAEKLGMEHLGRTTKYYDGIEFELYRLRAPIAC